jgi:predicted amidohydrolase YtcJ
MTSFVFFGGPILDVDDGILKSGFEVLVEDDRIVAISDQPVTAPAAQRIDLAGRTLMPGLVDAHVHVAATLVDLAENAALPTSLIALRKSCAIC